MKVGCYINNKQIKWSTLLFLASNPLNVTLVISLSLASKDTGIFNIFGREFGHTVL